MLVHNFIIEIETSSNITIEIYKTNVNLNNEKLIYNNTGTYIFSNIQLNSSNDILDEYNFPCKIDLIKLDVQGWEKKVLSGAINLLKTHKPVLIVEFEYFQLSKTNTTCKELFDFIRAQDYYIFYLDYEYPSDHVCVHKDNLEDFRVKFKDHILPNTENNSVNNNLIYGVNEKIVM
jgi:hypothetical protein